MNRRLILGLEAQHLPRQLVREMWWVLQPRT